MEDSDKLLACRDCHVMPVFNVDQPDLLICPKCDAKSNREEAIELATEYEVRNEFHKMWEKSRKENKRPRSKNDFLTIELEMQKSSPPDKPQFVLMPDNIVESPE